MLETWLVPVIDAITGEGGGISSGASVLRVARVMRVLRTARMARLVRLMPELMILIKGPMARPRAIGCRGECMVYGFPSSWWYMGVPLIELAAGHMGSI